MNHRTGWQQIAVIAALESSEKGDACMEGQLIVWKINHEGVHSDLYAIGRTMETAIVTRIWDWKAIQAVIDNDMKLEMEWREHRARLGK